MTRAMFRLNRPCHNCPFLKSGDGIRGLHPSRCDEIHAAMMSDWGVFWCHKTTREVDDDSDEGSHHDTSNGAQCVGAMVYALHHSRPTIPMRIADSQGFVNLGRLLTTWGGRVVRSLKAWKKRQESLYETRPSDERRPRTHDRRVHGTSVREARHGAASGRQRVKRR